MEDFFLFLYVKFELEKCFKHNEMKEKIIDREKRAIFYYPYTL